MIRLLRQAHGRDQDAKSGHNGKGWVRGLAAIDQQSGSILYFLVMRHLSGLLYQARALDNRLS